LYMQAQLISEALTHSNLKLYVLLGAATEKELLIYDEFASLGAAMLTATDDGSLGYRGFVTDMLKDNIASGTIPSDCIVYSCGPEPMLKSLAKLCEENNIPAQISMERHMLCGFGACFTCACKVSKPNTLKYRDVDKSNMQFTSDSDEGYALVCKDGPVFNIKEVIFNE